MLALLASASPLTADEAPDSEKKRADRDEKAVNLSPFVVSSTPAGIGRYALLESISAGRVRMDIMDSSQNISVLTSAPLHLRPARVRRPVQGVARPALLHRFALRHRPE